MMDINSFKTSEQLLNAIQFDSMQGIPVPPEAWTRFNELRAQEAAEQAQKSAPVPEVAPAQSGERVIDSETPIFDTLKANYPYNNHVMPEDVENCITETVDKLIEESPNCTEPGLLLGRIQCGKTSTFEGIVGLAFDKWADVCICLTKGTNMLSSQTQARFEKDYAIFQNNPYATINIYDVMQVRSSGLKEWRVNESKTIIVCKKEAKNLESLTKLFFEKSPFLQNKNVIIVDDEADFASRNYMAVRKEAMTDENGQIVVQEAELKLAKVSNQIDEFRKNLPHCRYLQVTATPYCLFLQPKGELYLKDGRVMSFRPRFTSLVPTHDAYIGGKQYFIDSQNPDSMYSHLYCMVPQKCLDIMGQEDRRYVNNPLESKNTYSLLYALMSYLMATAVRVLQCEAEGKHGYHSSALIHVKIDKDNHNWQRELVESRLDRIRKVFVDGDLSDQRVKCAMDDVWADFEESNRKGREAVDENGNPAPLINVALPARKDVDELIKRIFADEMYNVVVVNSDEDVNNMINEDGELSLANGVANIFIGGNILDRGITIKNMLCFFYGRSPKVAQQDTVLQHARMYGARSKEDMAVTRLHTSERLHKMLRRMNELDDQLRQWFVDGRENEEPNAVFTGFDKEFMPCAASKTKAANVLTIKAQKRILPVGFMPGTKTAISKKVEKIREMIESTPGYNNKDENGFFEISKYRVLEILRLIEETYVYDEKYFNTDHKSDIQELCCSIQYCASQSGDFLYALHRKGRTMNRVRENGGFIDAPEDGRTDLKPARLKAVTVPVIMFFENIGDKDVRQIGDDQINFGWSGTPFYWPSLLTQEKLQNTMYAFEERRSKKVAVYDESDILEGINPEDVLHLTMPGDGTQFDHGGVETRGIKKTTAGKYLQRDITGTKYELAEGVTLDDDNNYGLYSLNNEVFPFVLRPYKYILMRFGRNSTAKLKLYKLKDVSEWEVWPEFEFNEEGSLVDRDFFNTKEGEKHPEKAPVLVHCTDVLIDENLNQTDFSNTDVCQWVIGFNIEGLIREKQYSFDSGEPTE